MDRADKFWRWFAIIGWSFVGLVVAVFMVVSVLLSVPMTPSMKPEQAGALLASRPEFNRYADLVSVPDLRRGPDSQMNSYLAEFAFVQKGSGIRKNGSAWYNHVGGRWRLSYFKYDREIVYAGDE